MSGSKAGKMALVACSVASNYNSKILNSPEDNKLLHLTIHKAVGRGEVGVSPPQMGHIQKIPEVSTKALAVHAIMLQGSEEGKASRAKMVTVSKAMVVDTYWQDTFYLKYAWRATRTWYLEYLMPGVAKNTGDMWKDWLSFQFINSWTDSMKDHLINLGMLSGWPGYISECFCFLGLFHIYLIHLLSKYFYP